MWSNGSTPSVDLLNTLLALFLQQKMVKEAIQVLEEMESAEHGEGTSPNEQSYLFALSGLTSLGDGEEVLRLVTRKLDRLQMHPTSVHANLVAESWCVAGRIRRAQRFLESLETESMCRVRLEDGTRCKCLTPRTENSLALLAAGWASSGEGNKAAEVMMTMAMAGFDPNKVQTRPVMHIAVEALLPLCRERSYSQLCTTDSQS